MEEERMILSHKPVPGYRLVLHVLVSAAALYLGFVFLKTLFS